MTYTPIFIHFGPKLAKLVFWGGSGGYGVGWLGGLGRLLDALMFFLSFVEFSPNRCQSRAEFTPNNLSLSANSNVFSKTFYLLA